VKRFSRSPNKETETRLREYRPVPRPSFLAALVEEISPRSHGRASLRRPALAAALSAAILGVIAAFGGVGYAASAVKGADVTVVSRLVGVSHPAKHDAAATKQSGTTASSRAAFTSSNDNGKDDQYKPGKGCGDKNHIHAREDECKKPPK
jgi:hypothetical protein